MTSIEMEAEDLLVVLSAGENVEHATSEQDFGVREERWNGGGSVMDNEW